VPVAAVCRYEVIDFVAVLLGYVISGKRTLVGFYEGLLPWANAFMALLGRDRLPARSTLSRFLAEFLPAAFEALRTLFLQDLLARPLVKVEQPGGLWDRQEIISSSSTLMGRARPILATRIIRSRKSGETTALYSIKI
jgi:hypothetical protein